VPTQDFQPVFDELKAILQKHATKRVVTQDGPQGYSLDAKTLGPNKKPLFFGAVQVNKNYVSFHLMPVYMYPELLEDISPELKKHMQGKSCFNFKASDKALFKELAALTKAGAARLA
jgi:hypothetical protein